MPKKEELKKFEVFVDPKFDPASNTAGYRGDTVLLTGPVGVSVLISEQEKTVLKKVLDRNRTSMAVHGGLKSLFVLTDEETTALLGFLERI
jgi:hypothetical protein